jgi:rhodanese-related sulfurtransferase
MASRHRTIDGLLQAVRARISRYTPEEAQEAAGRGALLVDTRDNADRVAEGVIPGSLHIPLSVLPWRADPTADVPDTRLADVAREVIIVCNDGYSSSLAAGLLTDLRLADAGDMIGGFRAWAAAGLPIESITPPGRSITT